MIFVLVLAGYLALWPVPIEPVSWLAPTAPGYVGKHAVNGRLAGVQVIPLNRETGPEHVLVGTDGMLYAGMAGGNILRMLSDGGAQQIYSDTGGRPLGMAFSANGELIVADGVKGLLSISADGKVTVLDGTIGFANAVAVADNGKVYVTSSSARSCPRNGAARWKLQPSMCLSSPPPDACWNTNHPPRLPALSPKG